MIITSLHKTFYSCIFPRSYIICAELLIIIFSKWKGMFCNNYVTEGICIKVLAPFVSPQFSNKQENNQETKYFLESYFFSIGFLLSGEVKQPCFRLQDNLCNITGFLDLLSCFVQLMKKKKRFVLRRNEYTVIISLKGMYVVLFWDLFAR